jgi:hypothetical protein
MTQRKMLPLPLRFIGHVPTLCQSVPTVSRHSNRLPRWRRHRNAQRNQRGDRNLSLPSFFPPQYVAIGTSHTRRAIRLVLVMLSVCC